MELSVLRAIQIFLYINLNISTSCGHFVGRTIPSQTRQKLQENEKGFSIRNVSWRRIVSIPLQQNLYQRYLFVVRVNIEQYSHICSKSMQGYLSAGLSVPRSEQFSDSVAREKL